MTPHLTALSPTQLIQFLEGKYIFTAGQWRRVIQGKVLVIDPATQHPAIFPLGNHPLNQLQAWAANARTFIHPN